MPPLNFSVQWKEIATPSGVDTVADLISIQNHISKHENLGGDILVKLPFTFAFGKSLDQIISKLSKMSGVTTPSVHVVLVPVVQNLSVQGSISNGSRSIEFYQVDGYGHAVQCLLPVGGTALSSPVHYIKLKQSGEVIHLIFIHNDGCYTQGGGTGEYVSVALERRLGAQVEPLIYHAIGETPSFTLHWVDWSYGVKNVSMHSDEHSFNPPLPDRISSSSIDAHSTQPHPRLSTGPLDIVRSSSTMSSRLPTLKRTLSRASTASSTTSTHDAHTASSLAKQRSKVVPTQQPVRVLPHKGGTHPVDHPPRPRPGATHGIYGLSLDYTRGQALSHGNIATIPFDPRFITPKPHRFTRALSEAGTSPAPDTLKPARQRDVRVEYDLSTPVSKIPQFWMHGPDSTRCDPFMEMIEDGTQAETSRSDGIQEKATQQPMNHTDRVKNLSRGLHAYLTKI